MIRTIYRHNNGTVFVDLPTEELYAATQDNQVSLWIDMISPTQEEWELVFKKAYSFHPLSIEDTITDIHSPKLDDYEEYLFMVFHKIVIGDERMDIQTQELDVFLGKNYLITIHTSNMPVIAAFWSEQHHRRSGLLKGPVHLLYEVLDAQVDSYIPLIDRFEERLEELGDIIFLEQSALRDKQILNDILTAKSSALRMRRILKPQRDIVAKLAVEEFSVIPAESRLYFQDVQDHLLRLSDLAESMRDLASSTIETHLALANNRMNEVMKVLTMISTIFIPLGFFTGVYGMNFKYMPELASRWGYPVVWVLFVSIVGGMLWLFRRRRWI